MLLYPQLPHAVSQQLAEERRAMPIAIAADVVALDHPDCFFSPTGGARASKERLEALRKAVLKTAKDLGYPAIAPDRRRSIFDAQVAALLHKQMEVNPTEAAKAGVWEFVTCVLLCDVVNWRWASADQSSTSVDRFVAGRRNTFQRLWWRALFLYQDHASNPYQLVDRLGEDEIVQIMERPTLAGNRRLSRMVGEELLVASERHPSVARRVLIREGQKRLRRIAAFTSLDAIEDAEMRRLLQETFRDVAVAVRERAE